MYLMAIIRLLTPGFALAQALGYPLAWIVAALLYVLCSAGYAGIFAKAGESPVKAFVPVLNVYTAFKLSGAGLLLFGAYMAALVVGCAWYAAIDLVGFNLLPESGASLAMALTVFFYAYQCFRMSASFGKDLPAAVALLLAEPVFALVLGFGPAAYGGAAKAENPQQPFNVETLFGEDGLFDEDMNLKEEYKDEYGRK